MAADPELTDFVREHFRSVWAVELLLVMKRDGERCWPPPDLVRELRASAGLVNDNLQRFHRTGLVVSDEAGCWCYRPASPVLGELCDRLEGAYRERPVTIVNIIAQPRNPLQSLADAFKFRREDGE